MKETVFFLEGRGGIYLFHFFIFNLGGLFYIMNGQYSFRVANDSVLFDDKSKIVDVPTNSITFPIKIHMKDILPFQREAFEIIKDKFILVEDLNTLEDYEIVSIYGYTDNKNYNCDPYPFLRNLFIEKCNFKMIPGKRIYITRKNSESQHGGILKRSILNEDELMETLKKYNFEYIQLENYNTFEKIKLFMESEIILSTNSSSLTLSLFSNLNSKVVEISNAHYLDNYMSICKIIGIKYYRYYKIVEDFNGNFNLDIPLFESELVTIL